MLRIMWLGAVAIAGVATSPTNAQTAGSFMTNPAFQGPRPTRCVSTLEMQHCAAEDLRSADARMGSRYSALRGRLDPAGRQALLVEQRDWLRSRDRDCLAKGRSSGSMGSLNVARCWIDVTKARAADLDGRLSEKAMRPRLMPSSAFVGRWRGGEGTYMRISRQGTGFRIDNDGVSMPTCRASSLERSRRQG